MSPITSKAETPEASASNPKDNPSRKRRLTKKERKDLKKKKKAKNTLEHSKDAFYQEQHDAELPVDAYLESYIPTVNPKQSPSSTSLASKDTADSSNVIEQKNGKSLGKWFPNAVVVKCSLSYTNTGRIQSSPNISIDSNSSDKTDPTHSTKHSSLVLFYQYTNKPWSMQTIERLMSLLSAVGKNRNIGGRIRIAQEGVNATVSAVDMPSMKVDGKPCLAVSAKETIRHFIRDLKNFDKEVFAMTDFKIIDSLPSDRGFKELKVIPVKELVFYGISGQQDGNDGETVEGGTHLEASQFHAMLQKDNTVVIDVRNHYETVLGRFDGQNKESSGDNVQSGAEYIDPMMRKSTDFPLWLEKPETKEKLRGKNVLMYCTGGIRCERASVCLKKSMGDSVNDVFQLQGGIERYFKAFPDGGLWRGKNFVFDKREAVSVDNVSGDGGVISKKDKKQKSTSRDDGTLGKCCVCSKSWDRYVGKKKCYTCGVPVLMCESCMSKKKDGLEARCDLCVTECITVPAAEVDLTENGIKSTCKEGSLDSNVANSVLKWGGGSGKKKKHGDRKNRKVAAHE